MVEVPWTSSTLWQTRLPCQANFPTSNPSTGAFSSLIISEWRPQIKLPKYFDAQVIDLTCNGSTYSFLHLDSRTSAHSISVIQTKVSSRYSAIYIVTSGYLWPAAKDGLDANRIPMSITTIGILPCFEIYNQWFIEHRTCPGWIFAKPWNRTHAFRWIRPIIWMTRSQFCPISKFVFFCCDLFRRKWGPTVNSG